MLVRSSRSACLVCAITVALSLLQHSPARIAVAQTMTEPSRQTVEIPVSQLNEIQAELQSLRTRDAQRQASEDSMMKRLTTDNFLFASGGHATVDKGSPYLPAVEPSQKLDFAGKSSGCKCGGYPCQCPLPLAPCIDCPQVSTLKPYFNVHIFGSLKLDMLFSGARPVAPGTPFFLLPGSTAGFAQNTVDIHARQSTLGAAFTGPRMGSFQSGGLLVALFFNDSVIADQYGLLPLQAFGELKNEDWRFAAGLQFDVFSPGLPTVLPFSALSASGNSGNAFRGQLRLERFLHVAENAQWTLQGALSEPITTTIDPTFRLLNDDAGWPNLEGRVALGLGCIEGVGPAAKRPVEIGVSGVAGQVRTLDPGVRQVLADVWGLGADFRWKMTDRFGVMGELFTGQALGTYNAGIFHMTNFLTFQGIRTTGGWLEGFYYWTPCLHSHIGYGVDDPIDRDIAGGAIFNSTVYSNVLWDLNSTFRVGFEFTWRQTNYRVLPDKEAAGLHTQFQWAF